MPRIRKRGLDYYPFDTDFLQKIEVRRILKREGDAAVAVLVSVFSAIYAKEGYYVPAGDKLFNDIADNLYTLEAGDVRRIIELAVDNDLFDGRMYREQGVLTSCDIQQQYLFSKRHRTEDDLAPAYRLLPEKPEGKRPEEGEMAAETPILAAGMAENAPETSPGTHSIAQQSIAQQSTAEQSTAEQSKENLLLKGSSAPGGTGSAVRRPAEEGGGKSGKAGKTPPPRHPREWTLQDIAALRPPQDGQPRNLDGLRYNLMQWRIPLREQYAIICKSNYGVIGHPVWRGFCTLRESHGKIRQPGHFLLSLC